MAVKAKRKRAISVREVDNLYESEDYLLNRLVNSSDAYFGKDWRDSWDNIGSGVAYDENSMPYTNELELSMIRKASRKTVRKNPYAEDLLNNLVSFVIGKGHRYLAVQKKDAKRVSKKALIDAQLWLDELLIANRWRRRQRESFRRKHRDGETFFRLFPQKNGLTYWRFLEPSQVSTPPERQRYENETFGVVRDPDDVEDVQGYYVDGKYVDAYQIQHRKCNADLTDPRGLSSIYCVQENLDRAKQLLTSMSMLVTIQTAIAVIRKHNRPANAVRSFSSSKADYTARDPVTGSTRKFASFRPGSIIDTNKDTDYEFPASSINPQGPVGVLGAELRAVASSKSLPEYMIGSDASNANYASTMVAESPAVKFFESEQEDQIEEDLELIWASFDWAVLNGRLPAELRDMVEIEVSGPTLVTRDPKQQADTDDVYLRHRIMSPQTVQARLGLDPDQESENWDAWDGENLAPVDLPTNEPAADVPSEEPPLTDTSEDSETGSPEDMVDSKSVVKGTDPAQTSKSKTSNKGVTNAKPRRR